MNEGLRLWQEGRRLAREEGEANLAESARLWEAARPEREAAAKQRAQALQRARRAKRRATEAQRTPAWANRAAITAIYLEAWKLEQSTGVRHHVDHVFPLQGELVSGLHVEHSLQILTAAANMAKHNRYEVSNERSHDHR